MAQVTNEKEESRIQVGDDREFEKTWWHIEVGVWIFLTLFIVTAATGLLGRGPLANGMASTSDRELVVRYERIARNKTPTTMMVQISRGGFQGGEASVWVSNGVVRLMGLQRVIPEPHRAQPDPDGVTYTWPIADRENTFSVRFDLQPDRPGIFHAEVRSDDSHRVEMRSVTFP